jgi:hypothetical protein
MSYILHDPDSYETIIQSRPCTNCGGDLGPCRGQCNGSFGIGSRRRSSEEISKIKATRQREHEDKILAEAALIKLKRGLA